MLWAEFAQERVIRDVPHRHFVFVLPKALRSAFRHCRSLLPKLALRAWKSVGAHIRVDTGGKASPGAIVSIQMAGNFLNWHPHLHVLATAGAFPVEGNFLRAPHVDVTACRELFQAHVLRLLLKEQMISPELVDRMRTWRHCGFHKKTVSKDSAPQPTQDRSVSACLPLPRQFDVSLPKFGGI
jgi:hypothetical protein